MTRKHFIAIAAILNAAQSRTIGLERDAVEDVANGLANYFIGENPNFDEAKFLEACGF